MRTEGVNWDGSAISDARRAIADRYDGGYVPDKPRQYKTKAKNAQEAHEAIRPTDFSKDKAGSGDHARLYELIWKRALASQMASARLERTSVDLSDGTGKTVLRATGQVVKFPGRSEEHTSELQSLMRISYAVFCLKKKNKTNAKHTMKP